MQRSDTRILTTPHRQPAAAGVAGAAVYREGARRAGRCAARRGRARRAGQTRAQTARRRHRHRQQRRAAARGVLPVCAHAHERVRRRLDAAAARRRGALSGLQGGAGAPAGQHACRSAAATTCPPRSATYAISTAPRSTPNAATSAPRSTSSAIRSSSRSSPRRHPASSPPRCATITTRPRKPISPRSARRCGSNTRPSSTTASCCSSTAPISRWNATCPTRTGRSAISWASSIASSPPSTPRWSTSRATASGCTRAGATTKARMTATWNCRRSCRSCAS